MAGADLSRINTNIAALNTLNSLRDVNKNLAMHQARLASGKRINEAADDPAGLTLATKMDNRASYLQQAMDNIGDAKNLLSVAEGGLKKINEIVTKMRVKAEAAVSDTLGSSERTAVESALKQYAAEIDDIVQQTTWNGNKLLDGLTQFTGNTIVMQTGAQSGEVTQLNNTAFGSAAVSGILAGHSAGGVTSATGSGYGESAVMGSSAATFTLAGGVATSAGLSELASGNYTVRVTVTNIENATGGTFQLLDANGTAIMIDNGSGVQGLSQTFSTVAASAPTINTGRGLTVQIDTDDFTAIGSATLTASYARANNTYTFNVNNATNASSVVTDLDAATTEISSRLQTVGALMDRLSFKEDALSISKINTQAAFSRIMNADMAEEQLQATKSSILQSTATTMLAQANSSPQSILQLFR